MKKSRTATRTIQILDFVASETKGVSLSEISAGLEIPVTSTADIVRALVDEEVLEVIDERYKLYGIGVKAFSIGNAFINNTTLIDKARGICDALSDRTERTVFLGKLVDDEITYIYKHEPQNNLVATCDIGSRTSLHCTSLGKSHLAFVPGLLEGLRGTVLSQKTPYTITDFEELKAEVEQVYLKGYAVDNRGQNDHLLCVGAPIFDSYNNVIAAISVSGVYREDLVVDIESTAALVKESAAAISRSMGHQ